MCLVYIIGLSSLVFLFTTATPLQSQDVQPLVANISTNMIFPENMDTSTTIGSGGNALNVQCNGNTYGFNPNIADCEQAKSYIVPDSEQILWGERHTGLPAEIFPLPYAIFGGKLQKS